MLINTSSSLSLEIIQAIAVMASYSENGFTLIAIALRFALNLGIPDMVDQLVARISKRTLETSAEEKELYRIARVWYGICNLELL